MPCCDASRQEAPWGRWYSVPVPAGGTTGSLCARMCAEGCRPQPRHGSGEIADAASGFDDGRDCHSPQVVLSSPAEGSRAFGTLVLASSHDTPAAARPPRHCRPRRTCMNATAPPLQHSSVCSGIEAASLAWQPLGTVPAWFSEIDALPNAVLAHRHPQVPNLGDMDRIAPRVLNGTVARAPARAEKCNSGVSSSARSVGGVTGRYSYAGTPLRSDGMPGRIPGSAHTDAWRTLRRKPGRRRRTVRTADWRTRCRAPCSRPPCDGSRRNRCRARCSGPWA